MLLGRRRGPHAGAALQFVESMPAPAVDVAAGETLLLAAGCHAELVALYRVNGVRCAARRALRRTLAFRELLTSALAASDVDNGLGGEMRLGKSPAIPTVILLFSSFLSRLKA
jgi:hypothetical protein